MCGIAGYWSPEGTRDGAVVRRMTDALVHRGPDGAGHWDDPECGVALGHRRLAIVDLTPTGEQPMRSPSGQFVVVFNGEIYNHLELRRRLEAQGVTFRGHSDTEVMLALFEADGIEKGVSQLAGMFALALWDSKRRELWLARDRLGEKPLYCAATASGYVFGSELKALRAHGGCPAALNATAIASVLRYGYVPAPETIYEGIAKVRPGELWRVRTDGAGTLRHEVVRYWDAASVAQSRSASRVECSLPEAADRVGEVLSMVVGQQMMADVPVGAFLSGGIDSSLVVAMMQQQAALPVRTFTIAFEEASFDESLFARRIADHLGTTHTEVRLPANEALGVLDALPVVYDEPFADSSQLPTWLVSRITRQHVTVALSGDGGDELFGGYSQHTGRDSIRTGIGRLPAVTRRPLALALTAAPDGVVESALARYGGGWAPATRARLIRGLASGDSALLYEDRQARWIDPRIIMSPDWQAQVPRHVRQGATWLSDLDAPEQAMIYDAQAYLPGDILAKVDRAAMANSLETRAPLLDHRVFELAWGLPQHVKVQPGRGKIVLSELLSRHVPRELFDRPKQGFAIPLAQWLRGPLRSWAEDLLASASGSSPIAGSRVLPYWRAHLGGSVDHAERLWSVLVLLQWLRHHH